MNPRSLKNLSREIQPNSRNTAIYTAIVASGSRGETSESLAELCQCSKNAALTAIACLNQQGRYVYGSGPQAMRRYFSSQEDATAYAPIGQRLRDELVSETQRQAMKRRNQRRRERKGLSTERAKNAYVVVKGRDAPVRVNPPTPQSLKHAEVVIKDNVKITRCAGWTHDVRFQLPPGEKVIGGFLTEWRNRRAA